MKEWTLDLHIHTVLSPCGDYAMTPPRVLKRALELGIDALAITDHNTSENVIPFIKKGKELGVRVFPGMELQTIEDVHLVCIFSTSEEAAAWQEYVYGKLPGLKNKRESFGDQIIVDKEGEFIGEIDRMLLIGADITLEKAVKGVHELGGLCIAAHIDRQAFSLWGHLGTIPEGLGLDAAELTPHLPRKPEQLKRLEEIALPYLISSDAHYLHDMRRPSTSARMEKCSLEEIAMALRGIEGRLLKNLG